MKKRKQEDKTQQTSRQNPVAKFAGFFNQAQVFADKRKYNRKTKHAKQEVSPSVFFAERMAKSLGWIQVVTD